MKIELEQVLPADIEARSFELIEQELSHPLPPELAPIIKRVIHTTADFDYADTLCFSQTAVSSALEALKSRATIVTDTNMALAGINKPTLAKLGCSAQCFMADGDVAAAAKDNGTTRATAAMDKAASLGGRSSSPSATPPPRWCGCTSYSRRASWPRPLSSASRWGL